MINKNFSGYTYTICKKCGKLFLFNDTDGEFNDLPPDNKFFCTSCKRYETPKDFLKAYNITDKIICKEFNRICKKAKNRTYKSILKDAKEIASYKAIDKT